jgi:acyl carrier protein
MGEAVGFISIQTATGYGGGMETLKKDLRELLIELAALPEGFDEKADLYNELGVASMKAMQLLVELEERYQLSVPDEDFIQATSLQQLAEMIQRLKS